MGIDEDVTVGYENFSSKDTADEKSEKSDRRPAVQL